MSAANESYDILVIGGGINGVGIARDAAGRGLKVLLAEKSDLASATSSASSKLIHGGLRYLEMYEFGLVRKALAEREALLRVAPHIIWPLRFVLPHAKHLRPTWLIRMGLFLYDHLARRETLPGSSGLDLRRAPEGAPLKDEFVKGFVYSDCWVDDARLVVLNAKSAEELGARIEVGTGVVEARRGGDGWEATLRAEPTGEERVVRARAVVNAAGPWVESVLQGAFGRNARGRMRLVKGSHIVVPRLFDGPQAYILQNADRRIVFAIPYERDFTLVGTTDIPFSDDPATVAISAEETQYLCDVINAHFKRGIAPSDVVRSYSGVRPLYDDDAGASASAVTRDYVFDVQDDGGQAPLLSIYGGKITTYRKLAEHAMRQLSPYFPGLKPEWTARAPLPGGDMPGADFDRFLAELRRDYAFLPADMATRLARLYGTRARALLGEARTLEALGRHFGADLYEREVRYLMREEWARRADDVIWRRTKTGLRLTAEERDGLDVWMAEQATAPAATAG